MNNKDKETAMDREQVILSEKRAFELSLKELDEDKKIILGELEAAEKELKTIDQKINNSERLIERLDDVSRKAAYFSDAEQLKSIQVKDAKNLAATFKVLGNEAQEKKKELWSQITTWHNVQSKKKATIGQVINDHEKEIKEIDAEIKAKQKDFEQYIMDSSGDKAGKKRAKNVLEAAKDKKVLNSFNAAISIVITAPSKATRVIPFIFSFKKEGAIWKYTGRNNPVYDKKIIQSVDLTFAKNKLTINKDFVLKWSVKFTPFEKSSEKSKNNSTTTGSGVSIKSSHTKEEHDKMEGTTEAGATVDLLIVEVGGKGSFTYGKETVESTTGEIGTDLKNEETNSDGKTTGFTQKFDIVSSEGTINYSLAYLDNGQVNVKASGDHHKQQLIKDQKYTIKIDDGKFLGQF